MIPRKLRVLVLGGYGTFGGRLAQLLADDERVSLVIAGRSLEAAENFCRNLGGRTERTAIRFDRDGEIDTQLQAIEPDILVDASGPFQRYIGDPYRVVRAAIANRTNYLDLADGSEFVKGISSLDAEAKHANIFALSGVSSFPVLTAAVVRRLAPNFSRLDVVYGGIAPSPYAGVGLNVIRAIAGYAGKEVALLRDGQNKTGTALVDTRRYTIAPPGGLPLSNRRFSLVDVPDLQLLPELWPSLREVWMGAAPAPEIMHRALNGLARVVRAGTLPSAYPLAPLMHRAINIVRWGEHRGGMFVAVTGLDHDGRRREQSWHLLAEGDDGPLIPSMAAQGIIVRCIEGRTPEPGARPATDDLELEDYERLFAGHKILTGVRTNGENGHSLPLYAQLLGDAWTRLPPPIREIHDIRARLTAKGLASVQRGKGLLARAVAAVFGFPAAADEIPVTVKFSVESGKERWTRTFGSKSFSSTQTLGTGRDQHLILESFGPFHVGLAIVLEDGRLKVIPRNWSFLGIPLPKAFLPQGSSYEHAADGRFNFHVEIASPLTGLIVAYRGWLVPEL